MRFTQRIRKSNELQTTLRAFPGTVGVTVASITELLERWKTGDRGVEQELAVHIYPLLRDMARAHLRRQGGALTLRATELANEAYERLHQQRGVDWQNRNHFHAIAATMMRRVVIDYLRERGADKRGADQVFVQLEDLESGETPAATDSAGWLAMDQALTEFARAQPQAARALEMRLFSGLTKEEIADVCGCSRATVGRQLRFARAWLAERLEEQVIDDGE